MADRFSRGCWGTHQNATMNTNNLNVWNNCSSWCVEVLTGLSPPVVETSLQVKLPSSLSVKTLTSQTVKRRGLTNGKDSQGRGQNMPPNYAYKWRSPPVMAGVIWQSGADSSRYKGGESLGVITMVWREVEGKTGRSLILTSLQQRTAISIFIFNKEGAEIFDGQTGAPAQLPLFDSLKLGEVIKWAEWISVITNQFIQFS